MPELRSDLEELAEQVARDAYPLPVTEVMRRGDRRRRDRGRGDSDRRDPGGYRRDQARLAAPRHQANAGRAGGHEDRQPHA
jgi:hypothetical protein